MKSKLFCALATLAFAAHVLADDQMRDVQTQLKNQGFYYGEIDGQAGAETASAIRRYQIRNGLEVTGTLSQETLRALGMIASNKPSQPSPANIAPVAPKQPAVTKAQPPVNLRRDQTVEESDRDFLRREEGKDRNEDRRAAVNDPPPTPIPPRDPSTPSRDYSNTPRDYTSRDYSTAAPRPYTVPPPAPLEAPSPDFPVLFAGTPYANAPVTVQQDTLRRAQSILADQGFYRDIVDGLPGPATEEAVLGFQRSARLTLTGRLDVETLNEMRLLPGGNRGGEGPRIGFEFHAGRHFFRGIWVGH